MANEKKNDKRVAVKLTPYEWSVLLDNLKDDLRVVNKDQTWNIILLEELTEQLHGERIYYIHRDNPNPKYRPAPPPEEKKQEANGQMEPKKSWFKRLFS